MGFEFDSPLLSAAGLVLEWVTTCGWVNHSGLLP